MNAGRPTKKTPETIARLLDALQTGHTRRASCALANISDETLSNWQAEDLDFLEAVKTAEHLAEAARVARIEAAAVGGAVVRRTTKTRRAQDGSETTEVEEELAPPVWQADAWYLERKYRDVWSRPTDGNHVYIDNSTKVVADKVILEIVQARQALSPSTTQNQPALPEESTAQ